MKEETAFRILHEDYILKTSLPYKERGKEGQIPSSSNILQGRADTKQWQHPARKGRYQAVATSCK
jgi:hypothetical protein